MKRKEITALCLVGVLLSGIVAAVASEAGSVDDPLIALSWLKTHFLPQVVSEAEKAVDARLEELAKELAAAGATGVELRVKRDDMFELESGSSLTCLAGEVSILSQSAVVDITSGQEVTKKKRIKCNIDEIEKYRDFISDHSPHNYHSLRRCIENRFNRITLVNRHMTERLTHGRKPRLF